jgi:hypothetical protein
VRMVLIDRRPYSCINCSAEISFLMSALWIHTLCDCEGILDGRINYTERNFIQG